MVGRAMRDQRRRRAHARGRGRGFAAGVAAADHDDVEALDFEGVWSSAVPLRGYVATAARGVKTIAGSVAVNPDSVSRETTPNQMVNAA